MTAASASSSPISTAPRPLTLFLPRLALIVLPFPSFTDGRAYSLARQIREMGYARELRAAAMCCPTRCSSCSRSASMPSRSATASPPEVWLKASRQMSLAYQRGLYRPGGEQEVWSRAPSRSRTLARTAACRVMLICVRTHLIKRLSFFDGIDILEPLIKRVFQRTASRSSRPSAPKSAVLLHMAAQVDRNVPVIFIDTEKLFWETIAYRSKLVDRLGLDQHPHLHPDADDCAPARSRWRIAQARTPTCAAASARRSRWSKRSRLRRLDLRPQALSWRRAQHHTDPRSGRWPPQGRASGAFHRRAISRPISDHYQLPRASARRPGLPFDRLRPMHRQGRQRATIRAPGVGRAEQDRMRHSLDGERPAGSSRKGTDRARIYQWGRRVCLNSANSGFFCLSAFSRS